MMIRLRFSRGFQGGSLDVHVVSNGQIVEAMPGVLDWHHSFIASSE